MKIFISYRRADSAYVTDNVYSYMRGQFGEGNVFLDVNPDSVPFGVDFREHLKQQIAAHDVVLVMIGPQWAQIMQERATRADDYVRIEIESALEQGKLVIPVRVMGAALPDFSALPVSIQDLQWRNAAEIRRQPDFDGDCARLVQGIRDYLSRQPATTVGTQLSDWLQKLPEGFQLGLPFEYEDIEDDDPLPLISEPAPGTRWIDPHGIPMVYVPAGKYLMGSPLGLGQDDERPHHEQTITQGFYLDLKPVTNASYDSFIDNDGYGIRDYWTEAGWRWVQSERKVRPINYRNLDDPQQPRIGVSWFEAWAYCQWRGGRLPTEAEWEWAARGPGNREYPWGNEGSIDPSYVITVENADAKTAKVGSRMRLEGASWVGALDMSGNVWEWCSSLYRKYPYHADDGREDLLNISDGRVLRGGSYAEGREFTRSASRYNHPPYALHDSFGFRMVRPRPIQDR